VKESLGGGGDSGRSSSWYNYTLSSQGVKNVKCGRLR
jgi:hypothetical protein